MTRQVWWTRAAEQDALEINLYIGRDNPTAAEGVLRRIGVRERQGQSKVDRYKRGAHMKTSNDLPVEVRHIDDMPWETLRFPPVSI